MNTSLDRPEDTTPQPALIACRHCGKLVRPGRACFRDLYVTPPPYRDNPSLAARIVNSAAAARVHLGRAA